MNRTKKARQEGRVCLWCNDYKTREHFREVTPAGRLNSYCRECERARIARMKKQHPDSFRRAQKTSNVARRRFIREGDVTVAQLRELIASSDSRCAYCGEHVECKTERWHPRGFDHVVPRSKGGRHTISNLVVCCKPCNTRKAAQLV